MLNCQEIMQLALSMAGISEVPADSAIVVNSDNVRKVMMGVDIDTADLMLARELGVDLVLGHHPGTGSPAVNLHKVMERQIELMVRAGVPINKAEKVLKGRIDSIDRGEHVKNWIKVATAAKLLGMPLMNIHTPIDIVTENTVQKHLDERLNPKSKLEDVLNALKEMPEFSDGPAGPVIRCGSKENYAGKVFVSMAGGTNGGPAVMQAYFSAGVGTLVMMHIPEDSLKAVKDQGIGNVVIAGHMRADSVGLNLFAKALEDRGLEVVRMGGIVS
ncbi:MAG: hypothetical protein ACOX5M_04980 [Bacillota bacterium]